MTRPAPLVRLLAAIVLPVLVAAPAGAQALVPRGAAWSWQKGLAEPSAPSDAWRRPGFDDSAWPTGMAGFGYGDGDDRTVLADMQGSYASAYLRTTFTVADPASVAGLQLVIDYDDGFVAYLNGTEVARRGLEGDPVPHQRLAWDHEAGEREIVPLSDAHELLVAGTNVLAIQVHNSALGSSDLSCDPELVALPYDPASRGPYLQAARQDSVVVRWRTSRPSTSRVEHGDPALLERVAERLERTTEHEIVLAGLRPGTRYGYRVLGDGEIRSETLTFWTLPRDGSSGFDVAALGNSGTGEPAEHSIGRRIRELRPEIVVHAGGAVFPDGRDAHFDAQVFAPLHDAIAGAPLHPAAGAVDVAGGGDAWRGAFTTFANNPSAAETWWSWDAGNLHVAVLDATAPLDAGSAQWTWLRDDLRAAVACWTAVVIETPLVTGTALFDDASVAAQRAALAPLFEQEGVDLVLTSRVGGYERSFPFAGGSPVQQSQEPAYSDPQPIYVVTGGGGRPLEAVAPGGRIAAAAGAHHFVRLDVQGDVLALSARSETAAVLDAATIAKTCPLDADGDGVADAADNCAFVANASQANADGDAWGDACEPDTDRDGVLDEVDDCRFAADPAQEDLDGDGLGDACDDDDDADGIADAADGCPRVPDPAQGDLDRDGLGDACDDDDDGDTILDAADNCPRASNVNQTDVDRDGLGNACDDDDDGDGVADAADNCQYVVNPTQLDTDADGQGDHCDSDDDGDGIADTSDDCPKVADPLQSDLDGDGLGDACENDQDGDRVLAGADCDDRDPDVGGVPEETAYLRVRLSSGGMRLTWNAPLFSGSDVQIARGELAELRADRGFARSTCEATLSGTTLVVPLPATDRWYLVRFANACSPGPWGASALDAASPCP